MTEQKTEGDGAALADARAALEAAPLAEFVAERARLAAELKATGRKNLAKGVLALRKPSVEAWGLAQLVRREPSLLRELRSARVEAEKAQGAGDPTKLRAAIVAYRSKLDALVGWVDACLTDAGHAPSKEHLQAVREGLESTLETPAHAELPAAARGEGHPPRASKPIPAASIENVVDLAARRMRERARERLEEAQAALVTAESVEASARTDLEVAQKALSAAQEAVRKAREKVEAARRPIEPPTT